MKKILKLGIDLDDTVWKYTEKFIDYFNSLKNTAHNVDDFKSYSITNSLGITENELFDLFEKFDNGLFCNETFLLEGFADIFNKIKNKFEIYFITARPKNTEQIIIGKIKSFSKEEFPVHFCKDENKDIGISKGTICKKLGIDIMIDDGLHNLQECLEDGIKCLLLDYPWNKTNDLDSNIIRVKNWVEIETELNKILEERRD